MKEVLNNLKKYKIGDIVFRLYDDENTYYSHAITTFEIKDIFDNGINIEYFDGSEWWPDEFLFESKKQLIDEQIKLWEVMR